MDVEREAAALEREAEEPAAIAEQRPRRVQRPPQRQCRQSGGRVVLAQIRDVRQRRRREREQERECGLNAHRPARLMAPARAT